MNIKSSLQNLGLSALLAVGLAIPSNAQNISGKVYSVPSKQALEALVTFTDKNTSQKFTTITDAQGNYALDLPASEYAREVTALNHYQITDDVTNDNGSIILNQPVLENKNILLTGPNEYKNALDLIKYLTGGVAGRQKENFPLFLNYPSMPVEFAQWMDSLIIQLTRDMPNVTYHIVNVNNDTEGVNFHYQGTDTFPQGAGSDGFTIKIYSDTSILKSDLYIATEISYREKDIQRVMSREFGRGVFNFQGNGRSNHMVMGASFLGLPPEGISSFHPDEVLAANIVFAMPSGTDLSSWKDSVITSIDFGDYIKSFDIVENNEVSLERLSLDASFANADTIIATYHKSNNNRTAPPGIENVSEYFWTFNKNPQFTNGILKVAINKLDGVSSPESLKFLQENSGVWTNIGGIVLNDTLCSITPINSLSKIAIGTTNGDALPVELAYFKATRINDNIKFDWQTHSEKDNYGFTIQEKNKNEWADKTFIQGHGTTTTKHDYTALVNDQDGGQYRLKQVDLDGKTSYSKTLTIDELIESFKLLQNYPNPFNGSTIIQLNGHQKADYSYTIMNVLGQVLEQKKITVNPDNQTIVVDGSSWSSGIYFFSIRSKSETKTIKIEMIK